MAGADYTTIVMRNGKRMPFAERIPLTDGYMLEAVKSHFAIERKSRETMLDKDVEDWFANDYDPAVIKSSIKAEDIFQEISWNVYGLSFADGTEVCITYECPEMSGAAIAYVLRPSGGLDIMITGGNGRQSDPWLHILSKDISQSAEDELVSHLWSEIADTEFFQKLFGEWKRFEIHPNLIEANKDMLITDPVFRKIYHTLSMFTNLSENFSFTRQNN